LKFKIEEGKLDKALQSSKLEHSKPNEFVIPFDSTIIDREAHINKYAMMALGHAI
jgi:hypothetical protein